MKVVNDSGTLKAEKMDPTWNNDYHLLFVEQPLGVGWSSNGNDTNVSSTPEARDDFYNFLNKFFALTEFQSLLNNDLYIAGESYAGHYIPSFARKIIENIGVNKIPLRGILIGDGLTQA